jgi:hypothetical protein
MVCKAARPGRVPGCTTERPAAHRARPPSARTPWVTVRTTVRLRIACALACVVGGTGASSSTRPHGSWLVASRRGHRRPWGWVGGRAGLPPPGQGPGAWAHRRQPPGPHGSSRREGPRTIPAWGGPTARPDRRGPRAAAPAGDVGGCGRGVWARAGRGHAGRLDPAPAAWLPAP